MSFMKGCQNGSCDVLLSLFYSFITATLIFKGLTKALNNRRVIYDGFFGSNIYRKEAYVDIFLSIGTSFPFINKEVSTFHV